jgi:hypothetical protein
LQTPAVSKCEPPSFDSAGSHFNPGNTHHGIMAGPGHAGDMPNLHIPPSGSLEVRNAFEAMADQEPRQVTLSTRALDDDMIEIAIADIGPGIADNIAGRLFEPFVSNKHDGMGLGLSISRSIIEAHDGQLTAEPNPGGGTIFRFTLPSSGAANGD